ncbi:uncharacterized protein HMPREF1541_00494 [Cyphellophora europaea CBS 101466]|uniref:Ubiquitin-like domain-containing protein n=1 Tax=Cyphellophora europaea (strain CBS 101466) TaxID=1220924 RepID=W2SCG2_CYPE1|nr:uncharacterized protein HMPREF1541_00494 [Cyphellophora europaea CBS 101466]ETN46310.1 hypothetical protein HMPREF1541_00494 [Cyphellophora europaea CBS 101466]
MPVGDNAPPNPATEGSAPSGNDSNHVNLRVTYLHAGNPRPPHNLGSVPTDTTIGALKIRLQAELLENPRPEEQRLIYQGRPLLQDAMSLREALRLEGPIGPLPYTIHIIIQPRQAAPHFRPESIANVPPAPAVNGGNLAFNDNGYVAQPQQQFAGQGDEHATRMHAIAQAHANMLQQQIQALQQQQGPNAPQRFSAMFQINGQQMQPTYVQPNAQHQPANPPESGNSTEPQPQQSQSQPQAQSAQAIPQPLPLPPPLPLPQGMPNPLLNIMYNTQQPAGNAPFPRPLSVPPPARAGETTAHMATNNTPVPSMGGFGLPLPPLRARLPYPQPHQPTEPTVWLASSRNGPEALLFAPGHGYFSTTSTGGGTVVGRSNIGSQLRQLQNANNIRSAILPTRTTDQTPASGANAPPAANAAQAAQQPGRGAVGPLALQQQLQPGQGPAVQVRERAANDDFIGLVIQRGWLFLRLYMFMFVLSDPGTWRRYLLLALALLVCLLPRQNPLNQLMGAARRHIDNLIGPPAPQPRPAAQAVPQAGNPTAPAVANSNDAASASAHAPAVPGAVNITPEEAARRILDQRAEHERREREANPNVLRDVFYRVEQAVALFLASLIPGVGERHVAAREEQRRERLRAEMERANAEREAEERRRREAEGVQDTPLGGQDGSSGGEAKATDAPISAESETAGSSTGLDARGTSGVIAEEQLRERHGATEASQ